MPTPLSPIYLRAVEILSDGQWHDAREVLRECAKVITPGVAVRALERRRQSEQRRRQSAQRVETGRVTERTRPRTLAQQIDIGKRQMVQDVIGYRVRRTGEFQARPCPLPPQAWTGSVPWEIRLAPKDQMN